MTVPTTDAIDRGLAGRPTDLQHMIAEKREQTT
jgi:hypothetical protein